MENIVLYTSRYRKHKLMFTNLLEMSFIVLNACVSPLDHISGDRDKSSNIKFSLLVYGFKWIALYKILFVL